MASRKKAHGAKSSIVDADRRAAKALDAIDEKPASQRAALDALDELLAACKDEGAVVVEREVRRLIDERRASFRRFHLDRAARAAELVALRGESEREAAIDVVADAVAMVEHLDHLDGAEGVERVEGVEGVADVEGSELRALRFQLDDLKRGNEGKPRPFFARYLEHQRR